MMKISVKECCTPPCGITADQIKAIANCLMVVCDDSCKTIDPIKHCNGVAKTVMFSSNPPFDHGILWQKVNDCGEPIGKVKHFKLGRWV
jgi:hypothetical protein